MQKITFIDTEIGVKDGKIHDIGAVRYDNAIFHSNDTKKLVKFLEDAEFIGGHNIVHHDWKYLANIMDERIAHHCIDTLYLSPLLFPKRPYHHLLKDDKLQSEELNNPVNDSLKAKNLFEDEITAFGRLPEKLKQIYYGLLNKEPEFQGFFSYVNYVSELKGLKGLMLRNFFGVGRNTLTALIKEFFKGKICQHADVETMVHHSPIELAYTLALLNAADQLSVVPPWVLKNYPTVYNLTDLLCNTPCVESCIYCNNKLDIYKGLSKHFGYKAFRTFNDEPLQEKAVQAAVDGKSLLAVFPTGGGKSLTFQLPALMAGENAHALTVVISPLQSLMKDQVDNLCAQGISGAATINGLLSPVERADAYRRIANGSVSILYISPEMLRSKTIEKMLMSRNVVRFVVDEAHCFSAWGQDFRVDYLYIGDFIKKLQEQKANNQPIAVSCFTATAKPKVISDICDYFHDKLNVDLKIFATNSVRENLHYVVLHKDSELEKYNTLRNLIESKDCPTIVYVSRTKRAEQLAQKLSWDGILARPFHGKMAVNDKIDNQDAFIHDEIRVIVATSAFGMGVDKKNIGLVVHYDISDSLENYIQESGRAGRDANLQAECFVLYNDSDLDKHFVLLNQTKLSISEIQQVWQAIKRMTGKRSQINCSALELARAAGWEQNVPDIETRVRSAIAALEEAGYIKRGNNMPHVYATGILAKNIEEAYDKITQSQLFSDIQRENAKRIVKSLISSRSIAKAGNADAESRVDYLADILGIAKKDVIEIVNLLREDGLLADTNDMSAYIFKEDTQRRTTQILERFINLENFILSEINMSSDKIYVCNLKELNEKAEDSGIAKPNVKSIRTLLHFLTIKNYIRKKEDKGSSYVQILPQITYEKMRHLFENRIAICHFIVNEFYQRASKIADNESKNEILIDFSLVGLFKAYLASGIITNIIQQDVQDALLYLSIIGAIKLEGGFLVVYNGMCIKRVVMDNKIRYKLEDYSKLSEFYKQRIQQIHIVGEFANMMVRDYTAALQFVNDYFQMDYRKFIKTYFKGEKAKNINRNITSQKYHQLFGVLSEQQKKIIDDDESKHIVVIAGPGSGKTRVLVHKLAALLTLEDVKHEQLLMVTFSRAAATEFKKRLYDLIGNAAHFVEIKTFHSYCFDLIGKIGNLEEADNVVKEAVQMIRSGEVEQKRIAKKVLVIDEAQDMNQDEFDLIEALMAVNDDMRVIAVGDDDQNIYEFRGSNSQHLRTLRTKYDANLYELTDNFRSKANIVQFANAFVKSLSNRLKNKDIVSISKEPGTVMVVHHKSANIEEAVVNDFIQNHKEGNSCFMTRTNDEAMRLLGLLLKRGIQAKLIQTDNHFALYNLAEIRFFLKKLSTDKQEPIISTDIWDYAKEELKTKYQSSSCLENCLNLIADFEAVYPHKYRSDLIEFIKESHYEDFYSNEQGAVYVSTMHKSKGREFDNVYLMLDNLTIRTDEDRRVLYVAMTRAKSTLSIHCNNDILDFVHGPFVMKIEDNYQYPAPEEIALQLTHHDVFLDFFKDKKSQILELRSGCPLIIKNEFLEIQTDGKLIPVAKFSKACLNKIKQLKQNNYVPFRAEVKFIVAWKNDDGQNTAVLLPDIYLKRL